MNYPLSLKFKILAIAPQVYVKDAGGTQILYIKQQLFKLKEAIKVFSDDSQSNQVYSINADRIIDFSARYNFKDANGSEIGSVKREGMKSIWKASYNVFEGDNILYNIHEENPWTKIGDAIFSDLPLVGALSGYVFNPAYVVKKTGSDEVVIRLKKEPSLLESAFTIEQMGPPVKETDEILIILSLIMLVFLERGRG